MRIALWDTRRLDVAKDFAGGFGVGQYHGGGGLLGRIVRYYYKRDRRPVALNFAYLAAIFRQMGHQVEYCEDNLPKHADVVVFNPSLITLTLERVAMRQVHQTLPQARILVVGAVAYALPEAFAELPVTIVRGEPEQLLWKLDDVLGIPSGTSDVGSVRNLDDLPFPDWSLFQPHRFKIGYDFWKFPTGMIQQSRGCTFTCNYCPYIMVENATRFRAPGAILEELRQAIQTYGFRSFKFRDPLFGLDRKRVLELAEGIGKLPKKIQFSIESRIDLLRPDTLRALKAVGLTSVTVGIETPDETTLRQYKRAPIKDDRQREFVVFCRGLGIRTVAGFMIGFPHDTPQSIHDVLRYAKKVNPTWANFNIVTPYPGTEFFQQIRQEIASFDFTQYDVYTPVMKYQHLSPEQVLKLHARCFTSFYFRSKYVAENAHLVWPILQRFGVGLERNPSVDVAAKPGPPLPRPPELPVLPATDASRRDPSHPHVPGPATVHPPRHVRRAP